MKWIVPDQRLASVARAERVIDHRLIKTLRRLGLLLETVPGLP